MSSMLCPASLVFNESGCATRRSAAYLFCGPGSATRRSAARLFDKLGSAKPRWAVRASHAFSSTALNCAAHLFQC
eukprot:136-Chlamydomonas_euryale.AAC.1